MSESPLQRVVYTRLQAKQFILSLVTLLVLAGASYVTYGILDRNVAVTVDGQQLEFHTFAKTVGSALEGENVSIKRADVVEPGLNESTRDGLSIVVTRAFPLTLVVGGEELKVLTVPCTVAEVLRRNDVTVRAQDKVFPALDSTLSAKGLVRVLRVDERVVTEKVPVPFWTKRTPDPSMDRGKTKVVSQGADGVLEKTVRVRVVDGHEAYRTLVSTRVLRSATPSIVAVGTKPPLQVLSTSRGRYVYRMVHRMEATAYFGGGRRTSARYRSGYGVVAVDPRVIPLHSKIYVEGYGKAVAGDTGGAIHGNRIDLGYTSTREAILFGRRRVRVYILE